MLQTRDTYTVAFSSPFALQKSLAYRAVNKGRGCCETYLPCPPACEGLGLQEIGGGWLRDLQSGQQVGHRQRCLRRAAMRGQHCPMQDALACRLLLGYPVSTAASAGTRWCSMECAYHMGSGSDADTLSMGQSGKRKSAGQ